MLGKLKTEVKRWQGHLNRAWDSFDTDERPCAVNDPNSPSKPYPSEQLFGSASLVINAQKEYIEALEKLLLSLNPEQVIDAPGYGVVGLKRILEDIDEDA